MNLRRVRAVARKEFLHVRRDPRSLAMAIAIPMLMLLLFGYALTLDVDRVPVAVWDQSGTPESRALVSRFRGSRFFDVRPGATGYREIERGLEEGTLTAALVVPRAFASRLASGRGSQVQFLIDGSDSNTATIALGYAESAVRDFSRDVAARAVLAAGERPLRAPLDVRPRVWFNADLESRNYIVPGLIAVIMMVIAALLTSLTFAREWEQGTMEQLVSTPVTGPELILGKLAPYFVLGILDVALAVGMGKFLFGVPLRGSLALLSGMTAVFLVGAFCLGMVISIVAKSQLLASQMSMILTFLPSFLLSGFVYAIGNMPAPIRAITFAIPSRYLVSALKGIFLKGVGLRVLWAEGLLLALFGAGTALLANRKFRKKIA